MKNVNSFGFPFSVNEDGLIHATGGDDTIRAKIIQILFTAPGERIHMPEFGCGLFNLVFEPNSTILQASMEFTIGQALSKWMKEEIILNSINVENDGEKSLIEIMYTKRENLNRQAVRIHFR